MDKDLERLVWRRAGDACEYCRLPQSHSLESFHVEHIVARQHRGPTTDENLALACPRCNFAKGPNLAGVDPQTGRRAWLFHPRRDRWTQHFRWNGPILVGLTAVGRATIELLQVNRSAAVAKRRQIQSEQIEG